MDTLLQMYTDGLSDMERVIASIDAMTEMDMQAIADTWTAADLAEVLQGPAEDVREWAAALGMPFEVFMEQMPAFVGAMSEIEAETAAAEQALRDFNSGLQADIDLFGKSGTELEFANLDAWRQDQITAAEAVGADLARVEWLYGAKRAQILADVYMQSIGALQNVSDSISADMARIRGTDTAAVLADMSDQFHALRASADPDSVREYASMADEYRGAIIADMQTRIDAVNVERDAARDAHAETMRAHDAEMQAIESLIDAAGAVRNSLAGDISGLRKTLKMPGSSASEQAALVRTQMAGADIGSEEQIELAGRLRGLIMDSLGEEIQRREELHDAAVSGYEDQIAYQERLQDMGKSLIATADSFLLDRNISTLTNREILNESRRQFDSLYAKAAAGDEEALRTVASSGKTLIQEDRAFNASGNPQLSEDVIAKLRGLGVNLSSQSGPAGPVPLDSTQFALDISSLRRDTLVQLEALDTSIWTLDKINSTYCIYQIRQFVNRLGVEAAR
ncbi:MAG: hypothetical protein GY862_32190, partial [Gammaproteobacteria bacterium]|nr:hypothetical protein [Gammaproteobacteria bacterium]